jgi:hypothetical protein
VNGDEALEELKESREKIEGIEELLRSQRRYRAHLIKLAVGKGKTERDAAAAAGVSPAFAHKCVALGASAVK